MTLLEQVAEYALTLKGDSISPEVRKIGKSFFIDCFGCIVAGAHGRPTQLALRYSMEMYGSGEAATVLANGVRLNTASAAFLNGISSHFHDYDDVLPTSSGHPSAAVLPAVLALCEELDKGGGEALDAYIAGVEIIDVMSRGLNQETMVHYSKGWHSTESIGIFGSTAAAGLLLGLDRGQLVNALSMAASESCGLQGNFGTMTKAFHAGRAAEKAVQIAKLAKLGYQANPDIMEMSGGFVQATTGELDKAAMLRRMESRESAFLDPGLIMKPYPCCKCNHNIIDAAYSLVTRYGFTADDIEKVVIRAQPLTIGCLKYPEAKTMLEGKFSASYNAALVFVNGRRPGITDFEGTYITDERVLDLMKRIEMVLDDGIAEGAYFAGHWLAPVEVTLKDGRKFEEGALHARGEAKNPMAEDEVIEKLEQCLSITLSPQGFGPVVERLRNLESLASVRELTAAVEAAARPLA